jgi:hypothetical protein
MLAEILRPVVPVAVSQTASIAGMPGQFSVNFASLTALHNLLIYPD